MRRLGDAFAATKTRHRWTLLVALLWTPYFVAICAVLLRTPFPLREGVALLEDVARRPALRFLVPDTAYFRPLYHLTLSALWHLPGSLDATVAGVRLLQTVPVVLLVVLLLVMMRPRSVVEAAAATIAIAVLTGSPAFHDNLELPLSYTTVGMPIALAVWLLACRELRSWHTPAIVVLVLIAIGFKEQGLVLVPVVIAAWWMRSPGLSRATGITAAIVGVAYVLIRLNWRGSWPVFEQAVGIGFSEIEPVDAAARFGSFPYFVYAYSCASTIANVLFTEPTRGVFRIVRDTMRGSADVWQFMQLGSSIALTGLIAWWGVGALRRDASGTWSPDSRLFVALIVALLASGALSFSYSRDRLGGMALVFYAAAAFPAMRHAIARASAVSGARFATAAGALFLLACAWHGRSLATIEAVRAFSARNQLEWLVMLPERRAEFAERQVYLEIMDAMIEQGVEPSAPRPVRYPRWVARTVGLP